MEYPVFLDEAQVGILQGRRTGNCIEWMACCPFAEGWIYRLYLQVDHEGICLGVMLPEGGRFVLKKTLDKNRMGELWDRDDLQGVILRSRPGEPAPVLLPPKPPEPCLGPLPFPMSALEPVLEEKSFVDTVFAACGGQKAKWEGVEYYLAPGKPGERLGPVSFFCLLTWIPWEGSGWWVLCVDADGRPFTLRE